MILRVVLFLGLVLHKLVWEWMKRGSASAKSTPQPLSLSLKGLVKLAKIGILLFLVIQTLFLDLFPILEEPAPLQIVGTVVYLTGLAMAITGRVQLGSNWANLEDYQILSNQDLVQTGIYRYIRHPIYTGDILLLLGLELALNSWLVIGVLGLILLVVRQTLAEEAILAKRFPDYSTYRRRTKMFIPFVV
jgi:protein-S-isoprenylcysteine O-methyltransferase Ste14